MKKDTKKWLLEWLKREKRKPDPSFGFGGVWLSVRFVFNNGLHCCTISGNGIDCKSFINDSLSSLQSLPTLTSMPFFEAIFIYM